MHRCYNYYLHLKETDVQKRELTSPSRASMAKPGLEPEMCYLENGALYLTYIVGKASACNAGETWVQLLSQEVPLEQEMATHSSILAWRIPWTEEPGRIQFMGSLESDMT